MCLREANEVDHIVHGDDHRDGNLRSLCTWHHAKKSSSEGAAARNAKRRANENRLRKPAEQHPGVLD